jgi:hypothetical protein
MRPLLNLGLVVSTAAVAAEPGVPTSAAIRNHVQQIDGHLTDALNQARILVEGGDRSPGDWDRIKVEASRDLGRALAEMQEHVVRIHQLPEHRIVDDEAFRQLERQLAFAQEDFRLLRKVLDQGDRLRARDDAANLYQTLRETDEVFSRLADSIGVARLQQIRPSPPTPPVYENRDLSKQRPEREWWKSEHPFTRDTAPPPPPQRP